MHLETWRLGADSERAGGGRIASLTASTGSALARLLESGIAAHGFVVDASGRAATRGRAARVVG